MSFNAFRENTILEFTVKLCSYSYYSLLIYSDHEFALLSIFSYWHILYDT